MDVSNLQVIKQAFDQYQRLKYECHILDAERTELLDKLTLSITEFGHAIELLNNMENDIKRLSSQVAILQKENSAYQWKLNRIIDTWYGRIALKGYRMLRRLKRLVCGLRKGYTK